MEEKAITCVVADDHPALVRAVSALLTEHGVEIVAGVGDGDAAIEEIRRWRPTVAVLDLVMPRLDGLQVARRARRVAPDTALVLYTGYAEGKLLVEALDAGAQGFVLKDAPLGALVRAVTVAAAGGVYVDPTLAPLLVHGAGAEHLPLSPREREILRLLADGRSNREIAQALLIAPDTVRTHIRRAMKKLGAETRAQAVATAIRASLIR